MKSYPTTVYFAPLRVKRVPLVLTKPVAAGGGALVVVAGCEVGGCVVGGGVVGALEVPLMH